MTITIVFEGQDQSATSTAHAIANAIRGMGDAGDAAGGGLGGLTSRAVALGNVLSSAVMGGLNAVSGAFGSLAQGMIGGNAEFERYETQFGVLLGSASAAKDRLAELAQFGASTPFELPEVVRADKILQAFGLHSEEAAKKFGMSGSQIRTVAGDVAAGTGAKFEEISGYLGKFSSGATGEAISRMQELGITTRAELASMGVEFSKSGEMTSPVEKGMSVLLQVMQSKFGGMMAAQSSTFEGMMSNLQDWVGQAMRTMGQPIFEALKGQLSSLLTLLGSSQVQSAIQSIGAALGGMASSGISAVTSLASSLAPFVTAIQGVFNIVQNGGGFVGNFDAWASGLDAAFGSATTNKIITFASSLSQLAQGNVGGGVSGILQSLGLGEGLSNQVGSALAGVVSAAQSGISKIQTVLAGIPAIFQNLVGGGEVGDVFQELAEKIGVPQPIADRLGDFGTALMEGRNLIVGGISQLASGIQGAIGQVQSAISAFQAGMAQGTPGAAVAGFLSALGLDGGLAGTIGAKVAEILAVVQTARDRLGGAVQAFMAGWSQGTPGAAVSGFLSAMGVSEDVAGKIGTAVGSIATAIQNAKARLQSVIQAFQTGGLAGGATAILTSLGIDPSIVGQAQTVLGNIATAIQGGIQRVKAAVAAAMSGGGVSGFLVALGVDPSIVSQAQTVLGNIATAIQSGIQRVKTAVAAAMSGGGVSGFLMALGLDPSLASQAQTLLNSIVAAVQSGVSRIRQAMIAATGGTGAAGVLHALGMSDETVGLISGVVDRIRAVVSVLAANFQAGFQQAAAALTPIKQPLMELAALVGGVVVGAFIGLTGFIAGAMPGIANVVTGAVTTINGVLQLLVSFITGVVNIVSNLIQGNWAGAWQAAVQMITQMNDRAREIMTGFQTALIGIIQALVGGIISAFQALYTAIVGGSIIPDMVNGILAWVGRLPGEVGALIQQMVDGAISAAQGLIQGAAQVVSDVQAQFTSINWGELGSNIVQGIAKGLADAAGALFDQARQLAQGALGAVQGALGIHSPSAVMADQVGAPMAEGIAAGFLSAMDSGAIVSVVAGIRALMEQVGSILANVGDALSTSDWEDLANPVARMADLFKSITEVGRSIMATDLASTWDAARAQVASFVRSARAILEQVAPLLDNVGQLSVSDWEDFVAPLKLMAEAMTQITAIAGMFEGGNIPSLAGLGAGLARLASEARQLLAQLDAVIGPIGPFLAEKLKNLADAAGAAKALAENALGLVQALQQALTVDWAAINFGDAGRMMHDLAMQVAWFAAKAEEASVAIQKTDTSGLAVLKSAAESLIGIADGAQGVVARLVVALRFDWASVNFSNAGRMMADLARMVVYFAERALTYADALRGLDTGALSVIKAVSESLIGIVDGARGVVTRLTTALRFDWASVDFSAAGQAMGRLAEAAVSFARAAAQAAASLSGLDTSGLDVLKNVFGGLLETLTKITDLITFTLGDSIPNALARVQTVVDQVQTMMSNLGVNITVTAADIFHAILDPILALGVALSQVVAQGTAALSGLDTSGYSQLVSVMGNAQETVKKIIDLSNFVLDMFANGGLRDAATRVQTILNDLNARLAAMGFGPASIRDLLRAMLDPILALGVALAQVAADATAVLADLNTGGLTKLNDAVSGLQTALDNIPKLVKQILDTLAAGVPTVDPQQAADQLFTPLLGLGVALVQAANTAAAGMQGVTTDAIKALAEEVGAVLGAVKNTLDLFKLLTQTLAGGPLDMTGAGFHPELVDALTTYAVGLANAFLLAASAFTGQVSDAAKALGEALSAALSVAKNALDALKLFGEALAGGPVDMTGAGFHPELIDALATYAVSLANAFLTVANSFTGEVTDAAKALGEAVNASLGTAKNALEALALFGKALADGPIDMRGAGFHPELIDALATYAVEVANAFLAVANTFDGVVTDAAKALGEALSGAISTAKNALELLALFGKALAGGPVDMRGAGFHPELIDALATYAVSVATAFLAVANAFDGVVTDAAKALGEAVNAALGTAKNALEILALFGKALAAGPVDMRGAGFHPELIDALATYAVEVATAFLAVANTFQGQVTDAAKALGEAVSAALGTAKNALEALALFGKALAGGPVDMTTADLHPELMDALATYAVALATAFLAVANAFTGQVADGAKALKEAVDLAMGTAKVALDALKLFGAALQNGPVDMQGADLHPELVDALTTYAVNLSNAFLAVANTFTGQVTDAAKALAEAMGTALGVVKDALDFNALRSALASFRPLDMAALGPKIDALFAAVKDVAARFLAKANSANISQDMAAAADALAKVFGNAASSIKGALDMAAQLLDPSTTIPSIGQIDAKLTAVLALIQEVTQRFAAKAASIGPETVKSAEGLANAVKSVFDAISQVIDAVKNAADMYIGTSGFNNIASLLTYLFDTFDQFAGRTAGVEGVTAAITTLLGGIQALTADAGTAAGASWAQKFADAITANAGVIQGAIRGALASPGSASPTSSATASGGGGATTTINNTYDQRRTFNISVNNMTADAASATWSGVYGLVGYN